jgi:hypothetical protein
MKGCREVKVVQMMKKVIGVCELWLLFPESSSGCFWFWR